MANYSEHSTHVSSFLHSIFAFSVLYTNTIILYSIYTISNTIRWLIFSFHFQSINNLKSTTLPLLLPTELSSRPSSVPPTPNESRSLHGASSNRGSDSYSGSEITMNELFVNRRIKSKYSSADSILTMLRNFTSMNVISQMPSSLMISPSTTPSASSQHDESPPWRDYDSKFEVSFPFSSFFSSICW